MHIPKLNDSCVCLFQYNLGRSHCWIRTLRRIGSVRPHVGPSDLYPRNVLSEKAEDSCL
jgi:hypothetical protein